MKKSTQVPASMVVAVAASLAVVGCGAETRTACVNAYGDELPPYACSRGTGGAHWGTISTGGFGGGGGSYGGGGSFGG